MKKRGLRLLLLSGFALILSSVTVQAAIPDIIRRFGEIVFKEIPGLGDYGFKFLLWIILFALFNMGLKKVGRGATRVFDDKTSGIIAFIVSLASVILMPGDVIQAIFGVYAHLIILILGLLMPVIGYYFVHSAFRGATRFDMLMRFIIYGIMAYALALFLHASTNYLLTSPI